MTDYFDEICRTEYPSGATPAQRTEVNSRVDALEAMIFDAAPWL